MNIDLNADVGETDGEESLYELVSSVNIACGGHAGDEVSMIEAIERAQRFGCAIGAHPGYADRANFGRRALSLSAAEVTTVVSEQLQAFTRVATAHGATIMHVKPHGALYNQAAVDENLARAILDAIAGEEFGRRPVDGRPIDWMFPYPALVALADSTLVVEARARKQAVIEEAFADRAYLRDGTLAPRGTDGALITDPARAAAQACALAHGEPFPTLDGASITVRADTICIHGDTPGALTIARAVRRALEADGVVIAAPVIEPRA